MSAAKKPSNASWEVPDHDPPVSSSRDEGILNQAPSTGVRTAINAKNPARNDAAPSSTSAPPAVLAEAVGAGRAVRRGVARRGSDPESFEIVGAQRPKYQTA